MNQNIGSRPCLYIKVAYKVISQRECEINIPITLLEKRVLQLFKKPLWLLSIHVLATLQIFFRFARTFTGFSTLKNPQVLQSCVRSTTISYGFLKSRKTIFLGLDSENSTVKHAA
jgi:hypothetical protein